MHNSNKDAKQSVDKTPRMLYVLELEPGHWHALADTLRPTHYTDRVPCAIQGAHEQGRGGARDAGSLPRSPDTASLTPSYER